MTANDCESCAFNSRNGKINHQSVHWIWVYVHLNSSRFEILLSVQCLSWSSRMCSKSIISVVCLVTLLQSQVHSLRFLLPPVKVISSMTNWLITKKMEKSHYSISQRKHNKKYYCYWIINKWWQKNIRIFFQKNHVLFERFVCDSQPVNQSTTLECDVRRVSQQDVKMYMRISDRFVGEFLRLGKRSIANILS